MIIWHNAEASGTLLVTWQAWYSNLQKQLLLLLHIGSVLFPFHCDGSDAARHAMGASAVHALSWSR